MLIPLALALTPPAARRLCGTVCGVWYDYLRLFLNGAYFPNPDTEVRKFIDYIRTLDGRRLIRANSFPTSLSCRMLTDGRSDVPRGPALISFSLLAV